MDHRGSKSLKGSLKMNWGESNNMKDQLEALVAQMYGSGIFYSEAVREFKKRFILNVLRQNKGNQCRAARELGMHRNTLTRTINELKLWAKVREIRDARPHWRRPPRSAQREQRSQPMAS